MRFAKHLITLGLGLSAVGLVSCATPKPECTVGQTNSFGAGLSGLAAFAVRYVLVDGTGECAELKGDVVGMQTYHPASANDPQVRDFSQTTVAIRTWSHGEMFWMMEDFGYADGTETPNALGTFTQPEPDSTDFCQITETSVSNVHFPATPVDLEIPCTVTGGTECADNGFPTATCDVIDPATDPDAGSCTYTFADTDLSYKWSNLNFYVTAAATGTQFTADLEVTLNGCVAHYKAIGMWPAVDCTNYYNEESPTFLGPDNRLCHPEADASNPDLPRPYGSGINPDFGPVVCDTNFGVVPLVDDYYGVFAGYSLSTPRCALATDTIPALEGFGPVEDATP